MMPIKGQRRDKSEFTVEKDPSARIYAAQSFSNMKGCNGYHNNKKGFRENEITAAKKPPVSYSLDCDSPNPLRHGRGDSNNKIMSANLSSRVIFATIFYPLRHHGFPSTPIELQRLKHLQLNVLSAIARLKSL